MLIVYVLVFRFFFISKIENFVILVTLRFEIYIYDSEIYIRDSEIYFVMALPATKVLLLY